MYLKTYNITQVMRNAVVANKKSSKKSIVLLKDAVSAFYDKGNVKTVCDKMDLLQNSSPHWLLVSTCDY